MKKIMICIQALLASFVLVSCLHDDNELFNESAAQRLDKAVEHYKQVLESANNGWELQLWTEPSWQATLLTPTRWPLLATTLPKTWALC